MAYANNTFVVNIDSNNISGTLIDANYPNYNAVIPQSNPFYMEVNRKELLTHISVNMAAANKVTNQVTFSLNGNVKLSCQDIDFSLESKSQFDYIKSNFDHNKDILIAFNGKLLTEILKVSTNKTIKLSLSTPTRAAIVSDTNSNDISLLMPLMVGV